MDAKVIGIAVGGVVVTAGIGFAVKHFVFDKKHENDTKEATIDMSDIKLVSEAIKKMAEKFSIDITDEQVATLVVNVCMKAKTTGTTEWTIKKLQKELNACCNKIDSLKGIKFDK